jgi:hypothetical protein
MPASPQTLSTGEPDAGKPPVRFGGRGDLNAVVPTPIDHFVPAGHGLEEGSSQLAAC